ncbi:group II intron maturase-specific domain-containing protein [Desulfobacula sp.]
MKKLSQTSSDRLRFYGHMFFNMEIGFPDRKEQDKIISNISETRYIFKSLNGWIIRRLRCVLWKQWKNPRTKIRNLLKRGISHKQAVFCGCARKKHWRMSRVKWVIVALPNKYFLDLGLYLPGN